VINKLSRNFLPNKNSIFSYTYLFLCLLPIVWFGKDFLNSEDIIKSFDSSLLKTILFTFKQSIISVFISFLLAIIPSYYLAYRKGLLTKLLEGLVFIPFFFPIISTIVAFSLIFNFEFLKELNILYSLKAIIIANVFYNSPLFLKYISEGISKIPKEVIEAGKIDGLNEREIFFKIKLPLILPQVFRGGFLAFSYCFTSFAIVLALGGLKFSTLEVEIANTLTNSLDFSRAFVLGVLQFIILTIINIIGQKIPMYELKGEKRNENISIVVKTVSIFYIVIQYLVIIIGILFSFYNFYEKSFSLKPFISLFSRELNKNYPIIRGLINSSILAIVVAFIVISFTYVLLKNYSKKTNIIIFSTFGISSAFLAITLIYQNIINSIPLWGLLIWGYSLITIPIAYSFLYQYVVKFPKELIEAGLVDGASPLERFRYLEFPILRGTFISIYLQLIAIIFGEFTIAYTMQIDRAFPTIALVNFSLNSNKMYLESSALSGLNIIIILSLFIFGKRLEKDSR